MRTKTCFWNMTTISLRRRRKGEGPRLFLLILLGLIVAGIFVVWRTPLTALFWRVAEPVLRISRDGVIESAPTQEIGLGTITSQKVLFGIHSFTLISATETTATIIVELETGGKATY